MTTKPTGPSPVTGEILQFLDPPPEEMTAFDRINYPALPPALASHFGHPETTIITSELAAALFLTPNRNETVRYPDLLIAFNVNPQARIARNGYLVPEQGKPPDFVLEVASKSTAADDEGVKRSDYAEMGVLEYWRFDHTGGEFYQAPLAGDRLLNGEYGAIQIHRIDDAHYWGHSDALNLDLCWENGELRFWDPAGQQYLTTYAEEREARLAETQARLAETQARVAETQARIQAEARNRELEEQLRRLQSP